MDHEAKSWPRMRQGDLWFWYHLSKESLDMFMHFLRYECPSGLWGFEVEGNKIIAFTGRDLAAVKCPEV